MFEDLQFRKYEGKLKTLCEENNLTFRFNSHYPISMIVRPVAGAAAQMSMLENAEDNGYISPDASITFTFKDGAISCKTISTITISKETLSKLVKLFENMHYAYLQLYFYEHTAMNGGEAL